MREEVGLILPYGGSPPLTLRGAYGGRASSNIEEIGLTLMDPGEAGPQVSIWKSSLSTPGGCPGEPSPLIFLQEFSLLVTDLPRGDKNPLPHLPAEEFASNSGSSCAGIRMECREEEEDSPSVGWIRRGYDASQSAG